MTNILRKWNSISLVKRIICGLIVGAILGLAIPGVTGIGILGTLFVSALKAIAPVLVFFLVIAALACGNEGGGKTMGCLVYTSWGRMTERVHLRSWPTAF